MYVRWQLNSDTIYNRLRVAVMARIVHISFDGVSLSPRSNNDTEAELGMVNQECGRARRTGL